MADTPDTIQPDRGQDAVSIHLVTRDGHAAWARTLSDQQRAALAAQRFEGGANQVGIIPDGAGNGDGWSVAGGVADPDALTAWCLARLAEVLPAGTYRLADRDPGAALHGWQAAQYAFTRYKVPENPVGARVLLTKEAKAVPGAVAEARALFMVRDLVNTPAEDMGPAALETAAEAIARTHSARLEVVRGDALARDYPMVHAVGRAAAREHAPRLIHLAWGREGDPVLAIVGKGVCFDSGGLDIKSAAGMLLMKKDMGGAANVLALAQMVMDAKLKLHLRVLIPTVENAVAGNAFRPLDVFPSRKGLTVEIGNTDAEGRLILADALALADEDKPDLLIDMGTLTGAARVALGPDLPPFYTQDETLAADVARCAASENDPLWRMPLWAPYDSWLDSKVATLNNAPSGGFAGSITCALFLQRFVEHARSWLHLDIFAWTPSAKPGRPEGGECQAARALYKLLSERYG